MQCHGSSNPKKSPDIRLCKPIDIKQPSFSFIPSVRKELSLATMPRSATDATRFTSTTPHASAKPPSASRLPARGIPLKKPGPPGETPQEKVKRLRAAADRARDAQVSQFDKILVRGRVWADRAHRFTALSLIGITGTLIFSIAIQNVKLEDFNSSNFKIQGADWLL